MQYIRAYLFLKLFLAIFVPALAVVLVMSPLYQQLKQSSKTQAQLAWHFEGINQVTALGQYFIDAETGVRGFALTGQEIFLEPYFSALIRIEQTSDALTVRFNQSPELQAALQLSMQHFTEWQRSFAEKEIQLVRQNESVAGLLAPAKIKMDEVRRAMRALAQIKQNNLQVDRKQQELASQSAVLFATIGLTLALLTGLLVAIFIAFSLSARVKRIIFIANKVKQGDLAQRVIIRGKDELSQLAETFNAMADTLEKKMLYEQDARVLLNQQVEKLVTAKTQESRTISEFSELLQACQTLNEASDVVRQTALRLFKSAEGALYYSVADQVELLANWGQSEHLTHISHEDCWAMRRGKNHIFVASQHHLHCRHVVSDTPASLCIPLLARGDVAGVLHLQMPLHLAADQGERWLGEIEDLAVSIAEHIGLALANIHLREHLQALSLKDPLTGLFNRRYLETFSTKEFARASRQSGHIAVLVLDIDFFKQFNDTHGHQAGDEVLQQVAGVLQRYTRASDMVCRFGGEEFVMVMTDLQPEDALPKAVLIQQYIAQQRWPVAGQMLHVTVSIGVSCFPQHGTNLQQLLDSADEALYLAKEHGRNCVRCFSEVIRAEPLTETKGISNTEILP